MMFLCFWVVCWHARYDIRHNLTTCDVSSAGHCVRYVCARADLFAQMYGDEDLATVTTYHNLAVCMMLAGECGEAMYAMWQTLPQLQSKRINPCRGMLQL